MVRLSRTLVAVTAVTLFCASVGHAQLLLRYRGRRGQVAVYRLTLTAKGEQISLGERRPINVEAEFELREEVTATSAADTMTVKIAPRVIRTRDSAGAFGNGERSRFPEVEVTMNALGEVLEARPLSDEHIGPYQRAFASILASPGIILPTGPVVAGDRWTWEQGGARQASRFVGMSQSPWGLVARVETTASSPMRVEEGSEGLGLNTIVSGFETQTSELELLTNSGVVFRNKGAVHTIAKGEISLELAQGPKTFPVASDIILSYHLKLIRLSGGLIRPDSTAVRSD